MKLNKKNVIIAVALLVLGFGGYKLWKKNQKPEDTYREVTLDKGDIQVTVTATGTVQPLNRLEIKPPISGRVEQVLVNEGQEVRKGQVLAWMSSTERAALLDSARAQGAAELKRWEDLYKATPVIAPINGTIILRSVESGQSFTSTDAILVMSDRLAIQAQVDETDLAQITLKQPAQIVLDAYSGDKIPGVVSQIAYEAKTVNNVTTYIVDVLPEKAPDFMRSGMTANVIFTVDSRNNVLRVPNDVLKSTDGKTTVLVKKDREPAFTQEVKTGLSDGKFTEIIEGLKGDETLVVKELNLSEEENKNPLAPNIRRRGKKK